jgi:hypothetical protein
MRCYDFMSAEGVQQAGSVMNSLFPELPVPLRIDSTCSYEGGRGQGSSDLIVDGPARRPRTTERCGNGFVTPER